MLSAGQRIIGEVSSWPGVVIRRGRFGETSIRIGRCEIGHLHGDDVAHFVFDVGLWLGLVDEGHVEPHPVGRLGWAVRRMDTEADVADVIALLRLNYDRAVMRFAAPLALVTGRSA